MFFHVILTTQCNLRCRYCYGEAIEDFDNSSDSDVDYGLPDRITYDIASLAEFCEKDPDCILTFYGGEPLLRYNELCRIMDNVKAKYFMIQTNGLLLDKPEPEYVNRFHTILVSIDGNEELTDYYRGKGTFRKLIDNLKLIRHNGFKGELIARMTVMEQTNIYDSVKWLLNNDEFCFSSVHWQLNAGFWENDFVRRNFENWSKGNYNTGIRSLVRFWVDRMEQESVVLRLYPFLGIAESLLRAEKSLLRCGGGWANYAIQTDGNIVACPTMWGLTKYYLGHVSHSTPLKLPKVFVGEPCTSCDIYDVCGGRCLYANIMKRWNQKAYSLVCGTVRNLSDAVRREVPRIRELIADGIIDFEDFEYLKYNGCEIIP